MSPNTSQVLMVAGAALTSFILIQILQDVLKTIRKDPKASWDEIFVVIFVAPFAFIAIAKLLTECLRALQILPTP